LLPGSRIIGVIFLGGGGDTVNVRTGNQNLTFDTLAGATVTSTLPFVVSGNRVVTIEPTSFAVAGTALGDFSRSVSAVVPIFDNLPTTGGGTATAFAAPTSAAPIFSPAFDSIPGLSAYAADHVAFKAPTVTHSDGTTFWARGFAGQRVQQADGVILRNVSNFFGGAMGVDRLVSPNLRIGGFIGALDALQHRAQLRRHRQQPRLRRDLCALSLRRVVPACRRAGRRLAQRHHAQHQQQPRGRRA
jgi:hypothetical protein